MNSTQFVNDEPGVYLVDRAKKFWGNDVEITIYTKSYGKGKPIWVAGDAEKVGEDHKLFSRNGMSADRQMGWYKVIASFKASNPPAEYAKVKKATIYTFK